MGLRSDISTAGESELISRFSLQCDWHSDEQEFKMLSRSWNRIKAIPVKKKKKRIWNYAKLLPNYQLTFVVYHNLSHDNIVWHWRIVNSEQLCVRALKTIQSQDAVRKIL